MTGIVEPREYVEIGSWWDQAACRQSDPALFFSDSPADAAEAKKVCAECPVRAECLEYANANGEKHGVWGGLTTVERRQQHDVLMDTTDLAAMFQVNRNTVNSWSRPGSRWGAGFPSSDGVVDGRAVWRAESIVDWACRTGRAMRGGS